MQNKAMGLIILPINKPIKERRVKRIEIKKRGPLKPDRISFFL
jgi:hypothetical protein